MSPDEKIGLMVITSRPMGISQRNKEMTSHDGVLDADGWIVVVHILGVDCAPIHELRDGVEGDPGAVDDGDSRHTRRIDCEVPRRAEKVGHVTAPVRLERGEHVPELERLDLPTPGRAHEVREATLFISGEDRVATLHELDFGEVLDIKVGQVEIPDGASNLLKGVVSPRSHISERRATTSRNE